jgi:hypothetical protein
MKWVNSKTYGRVLRTHYQSGVVSVYWDILHNCFTAMSSIQGLWPALNSVTDSFNDDESIKKNHLSPIEKLKFLEHKKLVLIYKSQRIHLDSFIIINLIVLIV